jgi:hypothetical protein
MAAKRNYRAEYDNYHSKPEQRRRNDARKKARRLMIKKYGKKALKGKDIDHKNRDPKDNRMSNLRIQSKSKNRSRNK